MMKRLAAPDLVRLSQQMYYISETGELIWIAPSIHNPVPIGSIAGWVNPNGYIEVRFENVIYKGHHLAWYLYYGVWPYRLDHKDRNRSNNRILNLREATPQQNNYNASMRVDNTTGFRGVTKWGNKFRGQISVNKKPMYLGLYSTPEEAHEAYREASKKYHGEFSCL